MARRPLATLAAALMATATGTSAVLAAGHADVCLELADGSVTAAEASFIGTAIEDSVASRPSLFPAPVVSHVLAGRFDIWAGDEDRIIDEGAPCLEPSDGWTSRFGRGFLEAGADRMLAEAPTTPGIDSEVTIEWHPAETRLRTTLVFEGPLGIPNGTCWVDDTLTIDEAIGMVLASGEQGLETSLFAEGACGRFFDHLPDGGAGEQAVTLLPASLELPDGTTLRFVAEDVVVRDDAVVVSGSLERS